MEIVHWMLLKTKTKVNRKIFTAIVAGAIKKVEVDVTFLLQIDYEEVERMVKNV